MLAYFWTEVAVVAMQTVACLLLRRESPDAAKIMLVGTLMFAAGVAMAPFLSYFTRTGTYFPFAYYHAQSSLYGVGSLLFLAGALLHGLRRRAMAGRIRELELILAGQSAATSK